MHVKVLWNLIVPTRVGFFAWEAWWGKTLTMTQLKKKATPLLVGVPSAAKKKKSWNTFYPLPESVGCLASPLFSLRRRLGLSFSDERPDSRLDSAPYRKKELKLWRAMPLCMMWAIWKERNRVVFEDGIFSSDRVKSYFLVQSGN